MRAECDKHLSNHRFSRGDAAREADLQHSFSG